MTRILCFGDSNTWGYNPANGTRWGNGIRWTSQLEDILNRSALSDAASAPKAPFTVIEEGLNGRTTVWNDPTKPYRDGSAALPMVLLTHRPLDWVVIMLGTNDLKSLYPSEPAWIAEGIRKLVGQVKATDNAGSPAPHILIVSPPPMHDTNNWASGFRDGRQKSLTLASHFRAVAEEEGCLFFEAASVCEASTIDGLHMDETGHASLAQALADVLTNAIG